MIDILTNSFLENPVPLNINLNYCSHGCSYCFANLNSPNRKAKLKEILSQIKNYKKRNDLVSFYMREKYPIVISNNIDPFSNSNTEIAAKLIETFTNEQIPVVIVTRGGKGWEYVSETTEKSVWNISVPYSDDKVRQHYEPKAPSIDERFEMVKQVIKKHNVVILLNPVNELFSNDHLSIIKKYHSIGVKDFFVNKLHLTPKQVSNMPKVHKEILGDDLIKSTYKKGYSDSLLDIYINIINYAKENKLNIWGIEDGLKTNSFKITKDTYSNTLPIYQDFFNYLYDNKNDGDRITFDEFYSFFAPKLPNIDTNISKFIFNKKVLEDKSSYKKTKLTDLLHYYWQVDGIASLAKNYPSFSWIKQKTQTKTDFIYDNNHNKILVYHKDKANLKDYTILE